MNTVFRHSYFGQKGEATMKPSVLHNCCACWKDRYKDGEGLVFSFPYR